MRFAHNPTACSAERMCDKLWFYTCKYFNGLAHFKPKSNLSWKFTTHTHTPTHKHGQIMPHSRCHLVEILSQSSSYVRTYVPGKLHYIDFNCIFFASNKQQLLLVLLAQPLAHTNAILVVCVYLWLSIDVRPDRVMLIVQYCV